MANWRTVWTAATAAAGAEVENGGHDAKLSVQRVVRAQKAAVQSLVAALAAGGIDESTFRLQLREEQRAMHSELGASPGMGPVSAQASARAFFRVVQRASLRRGRRGA